jgi:hypothetical protein
MDPDPPRQRRPNSDRTYLRLTRERLEDFQGVPRDGLTDNGCDILVSPAVINRLLDIHDGVASLVAKHGGNPQ